MMNWEVKFDMNKFCSLYIAKKRVKAFDERFVSETST